MFKYILFALLSFLYLEPRERQIVCISTDFSAEETVILKEGISYWNRYDIDDSNCSIYIRRAGKLEEKIYWKLFGNSIAGIAQLVTGDIIIMPDNISNYKELRWTICHELGHFASNYTGHQPMRSHSIMTAEMRQDIIEELQIYADDIKINSIAP